MSKVIKNINKSLDNVINAGGFEKGQMQAVVAKCSVSSGRFKVLLQKTPKGFVRMCVRGFTALRINGLLKRKCKKGARKHYSKK